MEDTCTTGLCSRCRLANIVSPRRANIALEVPYSFSINNPPCGSKGVSYHTQLVKKRKQRCYYVRCCWCWCQHQHQLILGSARPQEHGTGRVLEIETDSWRSCTLVDSTVLFTRTGLKSLYGACYLFLWTSASTNCSTGVQKPLRGVIWHSVTSWKPFNSIPSIQLYMLTNEQLLQKQYKEFYVDTVSMLRIHWHL